MCRRCVGWRALMPRRDVAGWRSSTCSEAALQPADAGVAADLNEFVLAELAGGPLKPVWQALAGRGPLTSGAPTGMVVDDGTIYVAYEDGVVKALDAVTGALRWESKLPRARLIDSGSRGRAGPGGR